MERGKFVGEMGQQCNVLGEYGIGSSKTAELINMAFMMVSG